MIPLSPEDLDVLHALANHGSRHLNGVTHTEAARALSATMDLARRALRTQAAIGRCLTRQRRRPLTPAVRRELDAWGDGCSARFEACMDAGSVAWAAIDHAIDRDAALMKAANAWAKVPLAQRTTVG